MLLHICIICIVFFPLVLLTFHNNGQIMVPLTPRRANKIEHINQLEEMLCEITKSSLTHHVDVVLSVFYHIKHNIDVGQWTPA